MNGRLQGKVALITGSAQGIGEGIARMFSKEGAFVYVSDIHDDLGKNVADSIGSKYLHLSVEKEEEWDRAINTILMEKGHLDILVNNAGIIGLEEGFGPQNPEEASLKSWKKIHEINADSVFLGCKKAIHAMKKGRGSIINISSRSGIVGIPGAAAYASSKASTRNHTKSVALYACEKGYPIRCNSIHPAAIMTPLWNPMLGEGKERDEKIQEMVAGIPMHRLGDVEDVAYAAVFLASDESKYITGTELNVDGGILAGSAASPRKKEGK